MPIVGGEIACLFPEERNAVASAGPSRRTEFAAGRACARSGLAALGLCSSAIPSGGNRAPSWPVGVVGSISHSSDVAVAVLGPATYWECLGNDVELLFEAGNDIADVVCTRSERERYAAFNYLVCILFSAKESIYKAINPIFGMVGDFQEVEVHLKNAEPSGERGLFEACVTTINQEIDRPLSIVGRWIIHGDTVYTSAFRQRNSVPPRKLLARVISYE